MVLSGVFSDHTKALHDLFLLILSPIALGTFIYVKVAKDFYVPKDKVKYYAAYSGEFIINDVRKMRKTEPGKVTNATFGKKIMSVIYLTTGDLIIVNTSIDTLVSRFAEEE